MDTNVSAYEKYCYKTVQSGKITELYIYSKEFRRRTKKTNDFIEEIKEWDITEIEVDEEILKENNEENVEKLIQITKNDTNLRRTQRRLRRLINSNLNIWDEQDKFLTLTCPGLKSREKACRMFKSFMKTLRKHYGSVQYIAVMEIQDGDRLEDKSKATGDIHFHLLLFNCPYIPKKEIQNNLWKHGIVDIRKIEEFGDIAGYLVNYLSKDKTLAVRGKRSYFPSRGLKKPIETVSNDFSFVENILSDKTKEVVFNQNFIVENVARISYIKLVDKDIEEKDNDRLN